MYILIVHYEDICYEYVSHYEAHSSTSAERKAFEGSTLPLVAFRCGELSASTQE